jgi:hypothetical protein
MSGVTCDFPVPYLSATLRSVSIIEDCSFNHPKNLSICNICSQYSVITMIACGPMFTFVHVL